ncbi:hypothetical protein [Treponema endosymbiont of Eucomonympha sp.]|uniref:hypothetical protein n=1 Tax=Treponema endosymbiont of Eucomonympha sp. TaxID=1580831 RepID=UPI000B1E1E05|nr:hypothetical protein [Treponema endosymbiont of Eucomonympha sp.]
MLRLPRGFASGFRAGNYRAGLPSGESLYVVIRISGYCGYRGIPPIRPPSGLSRKQTEGRPIFETHEFEPTSLSFPIKLGVTFR